MPARKRANRQNKPPYMPTPAQIRAACAEIRAEHARNNAKHEMNLFHDETPAIREYVWWECATGGRVEKTSRDCVELEDSAYWNQNPEENL